jgi:hypothetical protein
VINELNPVESSSHDLGISKIADNELGIPTTMNRASVRMGLRLEIIENCHAVAATNQGVDQMRADEPGTAGDEHALSRSDAHVITILFPSLETIKVG